MGAFLPKLPVCSYDAALGETEQPNMAVEIPSKTQGSMLAAMQIDIDIL